MNRFCSSRWWSLFIVVPLWLFVWEQHARANGEAEELISSTGQGERQWALGSGLALPPAITGQKPTSLAEPGWLAVSQAGREGLRPGRGGATRRMATGLALLGSGLFLIKKGFDFHREADELYNLYLNAIDPEEISLLYQRTTRRDLKSQFSWTVGAVFAASGAYLLLGQVLHFRPVPPLARVHPRFLARGAGVEIFRDF